MADVGMMSVSYRYRRFRYRHFWYVDVVSVTAEI